ncbi:MAG: CAAX prenyl protease-related protein [Pirellulales bacterium]|nr:CAAX prenyl protease-related protein [Pirellulales bacterium]
MNTLIQKHRWLPFLLPFLVFLVVGAFEPTPDKPGGEFFGLSILYGYYPCVYTLRIVLTLAAMLAVLPGYREFPFRLSWWGPLVGVVGIILWVGLCRLDVEHNYLQPFFKQLHLEWLIGAGERAGFNPLTELAGQPAWAWSFLTIRFIGLALIVPVIEEFFLRGFVMRFVVNADWWTVPFGRVTATAAVVATAYGVLAHPAELLAAAVWFSLVTWLMVKTRNIWDCVMAHAVTNFLMGVYVVVSGNWRLM